MISDGPGKKIEISGFAKIPNYSVNLDLSRVYFDIGVERYLDDLILVTNIGIAETITFHQRASG